MSIAWEMSSDADFYSAAEAAAKAAKVI